MTNRITHIALNVLDGVLAGRMDFQPGLNIISGENGTLKTRLLQQLKSRAAVTADSNSPCRIQAISPKRNTERKTVEAIYSHIRSKGVKLAAMMNERQINDQIFDQYPSIGDLYYVVYEDLCRDGGNQQEKMEEAGGILNHAVHRVFESYSLDATWSSEGGRPEIAITKQGGARVPIEGLSLGEQEILSLVTNIYVSRDQFEVFLIDEPEVHLNWHLEERLFDFFDYFCSEFDRQLIVVTHSRTAFKPKFMNKGKFLRWEDGRVTWGGSLSSEQRRRIAGEAIEIVSIAEASVPTFFVEDASHSQVLELLARTIEVQVVTVECNSSANVETLFKYSLMSPELEKAFFLRDGDGQGSRFPAEGRFIHLDKYCIENYFLEFDIAARVTGKPENEFRDLIHASILRLKDRILKKNKFLSFLMDALTPEQVTADLLQHLDASEVLPGVLREIDLAFPEYARRYLDECRRVNRLDTLFPTSLLDAMKSGNDQAKLDPPTPGDSTTS